MSDCRQSSARFKDMLPIGAVVEPPLFVPLGMRIWIGGVFSLMWQALAAVFMMNNLHYIVKTVESSEVLTVLGEEWIEQHKDQVPFACPRAC